MSSDATPTNPPAPLLPYEREITFNAQVTSIEDKPSSLPAAMPFYYASFVGVWVYWYTDLEKVRPHLDGTTFEPYVFKDASGVEKAVTVINFQTYTAHSGVSLSIVNEVEFNICAFPAVDAQRIPHGLSLEDIVMGVDQTKRIGFFRIHVPADNTLAVAAGQTFFGEPKFYAQFQYSVPALNMQSQKVWDVYVCDKDAKVSAGVFENGPVPDKKHTIFHLMVPEINAMPQWGNVSPLALYTVVDGIPNGSHWQMLLPMETYLPSAKHPLPNVTMVAGDSPVENMAADIRTLIGDSPAAAIQVFRSQPACIEGGAYDSNV